MCKAEHDASGDGQQEDIQICSKDVGQLSAERNVFRCLRFGTVRHRYWPATISEHFTHFPSLSSSSPPPSCSSAPDMDSVDRIESSGAAEIGCASSSLSELPGDNKAEVPASSGVSLRRRRSSGRSAPSVLPLEVSPVSSWEVLVRRGNSLKGFWIRNLLKGLWVRSSSSSCHGRFLA